MGAAYSTPHIASQYYQTYVDSLPRMQGKVVVITGATTGIGFVVARTLVARGARVLMLNRPSPRAEAALKRVREEAEDSGAGGTADHIDCDLQSFASVRAAAERVQQAATSTGVDALVNNAGALRASTKGCQLCDARTTARQPCLPCCNTYDALQYCGRLHGARRASLVEVVSGACDHVHCAHAGMMQQADAVTADGYEVQMQTNHLSHFLLTSLLMPLLELAASQRGTARIVHHSSTSRKALWPTPLAERYLRPGESFGGGGFLAGMERYHQSKLANMLMTYALQVRASALPIRP